MSIDRLPALREDVLRALFDDAPTGIVMWRIGETDALYVNPAMCALLRRTETDVLTHGISQWVHPVDHEVALAALARAVDAAHCGGEERSTYELRFMRADDTVAWTTITQSLFVTDRGPWVIMRVVDITLHRQNEERLAYQSMHDRLTGLPNRILLEDRLEQALARKRRINEVVAVLHIDLDDFQSVNDALGHAAGDELIREIAARLRGVVRPGDTIARVAGDEFVVVAEVSESVDTASLTDRIAHSIRQALDVDDHVLHPTASIGIAVCNGYGESSTSATLLRDADTALHAAKRKGRDNAMAYTNALRVKLERRLATERSLRDALANGQIVAYYQPILDLDSGAIVKAESLVRWVTPEFTRLPADFLGVAEECGLMLEIGELVMRQAVEFAVRCRVMFPVFQIGVNLSIHQITQPGLLQTVRDLLAETGLPPQGLALEITETDYSEAMEADASMLQRLSDIGVALALDDFGTGYSSLLRAKNYPIDVIKIDQAFTAGIGEEGVDRGLVAALVKIARVLRLHTTLEGVETAEQLKVARQLGINRVQGFFIARALPPDEFMALLAERRAWF